jgi:hypothetical protein
MTKDLYEAFKARLMHKMEAAMQANDWETVLNGVSTFALVEIREAIEAQTAKLSGVQEDWDQGACAQLTHDLQETHEELERVCLRVESLEAALLRIEVQLKRPGE